MTEIDDQTIEKIANAVRNKGISDRWKDPKKAEFWGGSGWYVALILGVVTVMTILGASMFSGLDEKYQEGYDTYQKISLANMDCESLKKTLLDLDASGVTYVPDYEVKNQITVRCT